MNLTRSAFLILCVFSVTITACQPSPAKRSGRKIRVKDGTRSKQHYNFTDSQKATGETPVAPNTPTETPKSTIDTTNALCDRAVTDKCDALRVAVLEDGKFDGIDRKEASNAGTPKIIGEAEESISEKNVTITVKFDDVKNRGMNLIVVAVGANEDGQSPLQDQLKELGLKSVTVKSVSSTPTASELEAVKALVKTPHDKVLILARTQEHVDAVKPGLALDEAMTLVASASISARALREEILSLAGTVVPLNFITRHLKSEVNLASLQVKLNGRVLDVSKDFGTSIREQAPKLRVYIIKRELLNADSELKITYNLK